MSVKLAAEGTDVDYKEFLEEKHPISWLKSVSAFANSRGGTIVWGVRDKDHAVVGIKDPQYVNSKVSELISTRIEPKVQYTLSTVVYDDKNCLELKIFPGPDYPYYCIINKSKTAYVRRGDRSEPVTNIELNQLILRGMNKTFDMLVTPFTIRDISFTLLQATYNESADDPMVLPRDLISMKLIDEGDYATNAGLLLCDQGVLNQSRVVCTRWKGIDKGTVDEDALDDKVLENRSLIALLFDAEAFIKNNSKNPWTIRGMRREEKSDYPYKAIREVLVNALIHRDYQNIGSEIHVDMFDDRIEIMSPGGMMNGSRIQDLNLYKIPSMRRNEVISDIFGRLHFMDRRGSGIQRILGSYEGFRNKPDFYSDNTAFWVTLPNRSEEFRRKKASYGEFKDKESTNSTITDEMTDFDSLVREVFRDKTSTRFIQFAKNHEGNYSFNRNNLAEFMGITDNAASKLINKGLKAGIIRREKRAVYYFVMKKHISEDK